MGFNLGFKGLKVPDKFLFCQSLPNKKIKEAILKLGNDFTVYNRVKLIQSTNICSDHTSTMTGKSKGLLHMSTDQRPWQWQCPAVTCHAEHTSSLKLVLHEAVKTVKFCHRPHFECMHF